MTIFDNINDELKNKELSASAVDTGEVDSTPRTTGGTEVSGASAPGTDTSDDGKKQTPAVQVAVNSDDGKTKAGDLNITTEEKAPLSVSVGTGTNKSQTIAKPVEKKEKPQEKEEPVFLVDWENLGPKGILNGKASIRDSIADYFRWCRYNNETPNVALLEAYSRNQDLSKTGTENEVNEKKQKRYERNEQLGNFFMHLGDFVGSAGWGGPEQKIEDSKELTARQKKMRDAVEAKRNAYNTNFLNMALKQKEMDDKARKEETDNEYRKYQMERQRLADERDSIKLQLVVEQNEAKKNTLAEQLKQKEKEIEQKEKELEERIRSNKANERLRGESNEIARKNKNKGGGGSKGSSGSKDYTVTTYDDHGNIKGTSVHQQGTHIPSSSSNKGPKRDASGKKRINK